MSYNGWSNYETWLVNLWFDDQFTDVAEEYRDEAYKFGEYIREQVEEMVDAPTTGLVADLVNAAFSSVDWTEIAEHYLADLPEEEELEEDDSEEWEDNEDMEDIGSNPNEL